jgi:hypothetical protein
MATHGELERLAALGRDLDVKLRDRSLDDVADLALRLLQQGTRSRSGLLTPSMVRSYAERTDVEREGMRSAIVHVLRALVLLDLIELPS